MNHSDNEPRYFVLMNIDQRFFRQNEEEEYFGFENGLERMEKGDCQAKNCCSGEEI